MNRPIGLFDSGVGGLTVLQALEEILPNQPCVYFGDSAHFPYQTKSPAELIRYASQITAFLLSQNIQLLIVACHTASVHTLPFIQNTFPLPVIGMGEATLEAAKQKEKKEKIALLATPSTIQSNYYQNALTELLPETTVYPLSCPNLEKAIEQGKKPTQGEIRACLKPLLGKQIDLLILACTHYPHILHEIEEELDPETAILNPSLEVAKAAAFALKEKEDSSSPPHHLIYTSGNQEAFNQFLKTHPLKGSFEVKTVKGCI